MKLREAVDPVELDQALDEGLVKAGVASFHEGWRIYNYTQKAMYTPGAWDNYAVRFCRGVITDENNNIVARGWKKFFNMGQEQADEIHMDAPVEVTDKMDGSLGIVYRDHLDEIRVATRGSFHSEQAQWATKWIQNRLPLNPEWNQNITPLVEIIYPENKIVLNYDGYEGLVLLGGVVVDSGTYLGPEITAHTIGWTGDTAEVFSYYTLADALKAAPRPNAEGLVVRDLLRNGMVKIKQEDYLRAHAYLTNCTPLQIWRKIGDGMTLDDLMGEAPDEFMDTVRTYHDSISAKMQSVWDELKQQWEAVQSELPENFDRKTLAQAVVGKPHASAMFMLHDGKDVSSYVHKQVRPEPQPPVLYISEDEA